MSWEYGQGNWNGGYYGENPTPPVIPPSVANVQVNYPASTIPSDVSADITHLYIDVVGMTEEMDLGEIQAPAGMPDGCEMTIRKNDDSDFKIKLIDAAGTDYKYVDKKGETMTLIYSSANNGLLLT